MVRFVRQSLSLSLGPCAEGLVAIVQKLQPAYTLLGLAGSEAVTMS